MQRCSNSNWACHKIWSFFQNHPHVLLNTTKFQEKCKGAPTQIEHAPKFDHFSIFSNFRIFSDFFRFFGIFWNLGIFSDFFGFFGIFRNFQNFSEFFGIFRIFRKLVRFARLPEDYSPIVLRAPNIFFTCAAGFYQQQEQNFEMLMKFSFLPYGKMQLEASRSTTIVIVLTFRSCKKHGRLALAPTHHPHVIICRAKVSSSAAHKWGSQAERKITEVALAPPCHQASTNLSNMHGGL